MSLLEWKELAKSKSELGNKINYVRNAIKQSKIGEETSQSSFEKVFKPITSKLDKVFNIEDDSDSTTPQKKKRPQKIMEVPDYCTDEIGEVEDMNISDLYDEQPVQPQQEKQIVPEPPEYVDPQLLPQFVLDDLAEPPPEYDEDEEVDYTIADEDTTKERLLNLNLPNYDNIEEFVNHPEMTNKNKIIYINMVRKRAEKERQRLNGSKADVTKKYKAGVINEATRQERNKKINDDRAILTEFIKFNKELVKELNNKNEEQKGSGIKGRGMIKKAEKERNRIKGHKANITKKYNGGAISEAERQIMNKRLDNQIAALNKYIKDHKKKLESEKKIKGRRRKQRGGNVIFFDDPKQLLNKLELIIGETIAGNTSIKMRNMGVTILDTLLGMSTINRPQYNKLYNLYFKV